jgi:hypothetical protein
MLPRGGSPIPSGWIRLALIVVLVLVVWYLIATLAHGVSEEQPATGTGSVTPIEQRLVT